ncbi:hypothetical protein E0Z10_g8725 [Xylaria hypoxylon]|uniref:G-patch domain-containing protein n=1 Tax=Xylaria hypoxylon TaxID=37992 RepID=A0A4Z0YR56_9PEZI|nr:hypothetical protein E0Z10_g8725 [Xylaria hypoxylon]
MATTSNPNKEDLEFRNEVIDKLLDSVDCARHLKDSFGQFLGNITADANHKHLAYHLFCTVTLYISKQISLDEEQMSVLCRKHSTVSSYAESNVACPKQSDLSSSDTLPSAEVQGKITSAAKDVVNGNVDNLCTTLEHINIARSRTPDSFGREAKKYVPVTPHFYQAVNPNDAANLKSHYPFGYRVMTKQGWSANSGLGPDGTGIRRPIDANTSAYACHSPIGLGYHIYAPKAGSNVPVGGNSEKVEKQTIKLTGAAKAWNQYVADPDTGDKIAKTVYRYDDAINPVRLTRLTHTPTQTQPIPSTTNNNTKTIVQDQCVISDKWKDTSNYTSARYAQKNISQGIPGKTGKTSVESGDFVPCSSSNLEGWGGW